MVRSAGLTVARTSRNPGAVRVSLLIPTHSLPPLSYRVPERLRTETRVGAAVVAPLSGHPRLGIVVATERDDYQAREDLWSVAGALSLPADLVELCRWVSQAAAVALPVVLRAALPPGLNTGRYRILDPARGWPWRSGSFVGRATLKRTLGREGLRAAEVAGRIELAPATAGETVEWAVAVDGASPNLARAPRQRELFELLSRCEDGYRTSSLLSETGASRSTLRELVRRRAVTLIRRPDPPPVFAAEGGAANAGHLDPFWADAQRVVRRGGAWLWRTPTREQPAAVAAVAGAAVGQGWQALVLAPEIGEVERLVRHLRSTLPAGRTVAAYHSGLGRGRAAAYEAVRTGRVDVLVGTRAAALLPFARLGSICVVDEPNEAHRAEPGYEGLPIHVRDVALERGRIEGAGVLCLSPFPSLRLYGGRHPVQELPARLPREWPSVRIVDMRGSGASLSSTLLEACHQSLDERPRRVGVVANRLGYATTVACNGCGAVRSCPDCDLPLIPYDSTKLLVCPRCGRPEKASRRCPRCGSDRFQPTGLTAERVREELSNSLGERVGLITARERELQDARVVVGTARTLLHGAWDAVVFPDADGFLLGGTIGAAERAFRLLYGAAEAARDLLLLQTRLPEHYALRAAMRGDYPAFAAAELPRMRALGYPPFAHLASLTFRGPEAAVRGAVELRLRPVLERGVEMSALVPLARATGGSPARTSWRVLLRSEDRSVAASTATLAARLAAKTPGLEVLVEVDPEEV